MPDRHYDHRFHAGNVGDVWKHVAIVALFGAIEDEQKTAPRLIVDTHAGAGLYPLASTGEWTEGIGKLLAATGGARAPASPARTRTPRSVDRYLELAVEHGAARDADRSYPGSPRILRASMRERDRLVAFELDDAVRAELERTRPRDAPSIRVEGGDGMKGLARLIESREFGDAPLVVLVDPPYADRREWQDVPAAIARSHRARPDARFLLWYPIKSYARPNAMLAQIAKDGVAATAIELITSPLTSKKNRLNGSGLLFVGAPDALLEDLAATATWLGPRLSAGGGFYTVRVVRS